MEIAFNFEIGNRVMTPFEKEGIVRMAAIDREGKQYYIKTEKVEQWFYEDELTIINYME